MQSEEDITSKFEYLAQKFAINYNKHVQEFKSENLRDKIIKTRQKNLSTDTVKDLLLHNIDDYICNEKSLKYEKNLKIKLKNESLTSEKSKQRSFK